MHYALLLIAFVLRVLLTVLKKLLNKAAKVTIDIVKNNLIPFLKDIGAVIAQEIIEFIFSFATEVATDIKKEQANSTKPQHQTTQKPTAPTQGFKVGQWYEVYTKKSIPFKSVICKVCCFSNQVGGATGKAPKGKKNMSDRLMDLMWSDLNHLRQKAVQAIFALVDIVMDHKSPIKAEVIYDKRTKLPIMVAGTNPPRHKFMESPGGGHRVGADVVIVANIMKAPTIDNIVRWVEIKFLDSDDKPRKDQMDIYAGIVGTSKLAMIRVSANPKDSDCSCKAKTLPQDNQKPSSIPKGKSTSKINQLRELWDIITTNIEKHL